MRPNSRNSFLLLSAYCFVLIASTGCESLQKKFTRKPKTSTRPTPIISFQDYTRAITPLDRYRKHYVLFEYWNAELLQALGESTPNLKRLKKASGESLSELKTVQGLLVDEMTTSLQRVIDERAHLDTQLQHESVTTFQYPVMRHVLEAQARQISRELFWRKIEDRLKPAEPSSTNAAGH